MRWLKHLSTAHDDERISALIDEHGPEGYGAWWLILEAIACSMEPKSIRCSVTYSEAKWSSLLRVSTRKLRNFLETMSKLSLIDVKSTDNRVQIDVPKLLKYRDEYSKKSGETPEQERDRETDTDTEREYGDDSEIAEDPLPAKPKLVALTPLESATREIALAIWTRHPSHRRSRLSVIEKRLRENVTEIPSVAEKIKRMREIDARHARWCASEQWAGKGMVNNLGNWFTHGNCMNEPEGSMRPPEPRRITGEMFPDLR